ncbi:MAG: hypothetical protein ACYTXC_05910 [Nostoc sp.]
MKADKSARVVWTPRSKETGLPNSRFFLLKNWALGIGRWALGIGHWLLILVPHCLTPFFT